MLTKEQLKDYVFYLFNKKHNSNLDLHDFEIHEVLKFNIDLNVYYFDYDCDEYVNDYFLISINDYYQYIASKRLEKINKIKERLFCSSDNL